MFIAELGVEALCLGFYPGPSCMGKTTKKNPAAAVHVTTGLCAYLLQFAPSMRKHVAQSSLCAAAGQSPADKRSQTTRRKQTRL